MKKICLVLIIFALGFTSCASFSKKISKDEYHGLSKDNVHEIEGTYEFEALKSFASKGRNVRKIDNNVEQLDYYIVGTRLELNPAELAVAIKIVSKDKISFTFKRNDIFLFEQTIKMKLKSNGFIHLKNKHLKIKGIPLLYGGVESDKMRIGISENGELVLHYAYDIFGSFIFFSSGRTYNRTHYYKRIPATS